MSIDIASFRIPYKGNTQFHFAFFEDLHMEAENFAASQFKKDIEEAARLNARINIGGDILDLILPSDMKRFTRGRDNSDVDAALNHSVEFAFETLRPYVDLIDTLAMGNHETNTLHRHHYDTTRGIITLLSTVRSKSLEPIHQGGYKGFLTYTFIDADNEGRRKRIDIFHFHGKGGSAPRTKGFLDFTTARCDFDADIYWFGHKHTGAVDAAAERAYVDRGGVLRNRPQLCFYTPGYQRSLTHRSYDERGYLQTFEDTFHSHNSNGNALVLVNLRISKGLPLLSMRLLTGEKQIENYSDEDSLREF